MHAHLPPLPEQQLKQILSKLNSANVSSLTGRILELIPQLTLSPPYELITDPLGNSSVLIDLDKPRNGRTVREEAVDLLALGLGATVMIPGKDKLVSATFGNLWSLHTFGACMPDMRTIVRGTMLEQGLSATLYHEPGDYHVVPIDLEFLPIFARQPIRNKLLSLGAEEPKAAKIISPQTIPAEAISFNIFIEDLESSEAAQYLIEELRWFLPPSYKLALVTSEEEPGFERF